MKAFQSLWLAALLIPMGACEDTSGSSSDPFGDATVVEVSATTTDSSTDEGQSSASDGLAEVSWDVAISDLVSEETAQVADSGSPDVPTPEDTSGPDGLPAGLTGEEPPSSQALPSLAGVVDTTGAPVLEDQLKDHWSVMWFYPLASTSS